MVLFSFYFILLIIYLFNILKKKSQLYLECIYVFYLITLWLSIC